MCSFSEIVQTIANISTTLALIVALIVVIVEIRSSRSAREYQSFLTLLENYQRIVGERKDQWKKIKEVVKENPKIACEIPDKQNSLSYLLIRQEQTEPMYAIEHGLIDRELKSLNFLDKLCEIAIKNDSALQVLLLTDADEISYYKTRLKDLLKLYETQKEERLFPKPRYNSLNKCNISGYFGQKTELGNPADS